MVGLAGLTISAAAEPTQSNSQAAPQIAQARATCRTPEVEARIQELTKEIAQRERGDENARQGITSATLKGYPIDANSYAYRTLYGQVQKSQQLREELASLEGLPPCPQPVAVTPPVYTPPAVYGTGAYTPPINPGYRPSYNSPVTPQSPGYNGFYYTPGVSAPPPYNPGLYNGPGLYNAPGVYNAPGLYNAPIAPPPQ